MRSNGMTADQLRAAKGIATYHASYTKLYIIDLSLRHQSETVPYTPQKVGEFVCQQELVGSLEAGVSYILVLTSREGRLTSLAARWAIGDPQNGTAVPAGQLPSLAALIWCKTASPPVWANLPRALEHGQ
jgi:hypothetical protein